MADAGGDAGHGSEARARLMREVAEQMDAIETEYGDGFEIGRVITVVELKRPDQGIELRVRAGQYPWVAVGMLEWAKKVVESLGAPGQGEDD